METTTKRKRRRYSKLERQQLVAAWRSSGESAAKFGERHGLNSSNLWRWARVGEQADRDARRGRRSATHGFVELRAATSQSEVARTDHGSAHFEVVCPTGVRVRVFAGVGTDELTRLVAALGGRGSC